MTINRNSIIDGEENRKSRVFSSTNENRLKMTRVAWSGHHLKFTWSLIGSPKRAPLKTITMRGGWVRRYWNYKGASIIANIKTLDIWIKKGKTKSAEKLLFEAWNRADLIAREFSTWQEIAIRPIESEHPADIQRAHIVLENKDLSRELAPFANGPSAELSGMHYDDSSHRKKIEFEGNYSAEATLGADWVFLKLPREFVELKAAIGLLEAENRMLADTTRKLIETIKEGRK